MSRSDFRAGGLALRWVASLPLLLGLLAAGPRFVPVVRAASFTVTSTADSGPGSLRQAIEDANAMPGAASITFALSGTITLTSALPPITDPAGLSIDGGTQSVTVSGNDAVRPFQIAAGALLELQRLTVTAGRASTGAGIANSGGTLIIANSTISSNVAGFGNGGGGLLNESGTVTIINSVISGNGTLYAGNGGGIINKGTLTISNSMISGNATFTFSGSQGGGIVNDGMLTIIDSTISENRAIGDSAGGGSHTRGGGIVNSGILFITRSTISGNRAGSGGGIANSLAGTLTISNSTISGNRAAGGCFRAFCSPGAGGGISGDNVVIASSTISANSASGIGGDSRGGGISGTATLANTILAANNAAVGPDCSGSLTPAAPNLVGDPAGCTIPGRPPLVGDPLLGPLQDNGGPTHTHALLAGSPAIDAGDPAGCTDPAGNPLTIDQRGQPRPMDGDGDGTAVCDLGAYELADDSTPPLPGVAESISNLIEAAAALGFQQGVDLLQNAISSLNRNNRHAACGQVGAFINQVEAQSGKLLPSVEANQLLLAATNVQQALACR